VKVGDKVNIRFRRNTHETYQEKEFLVSGIMSQTVKEQENQSYTAYVSKACYESLYAPEERAYTIYFSLSDSVDVNSSTLEMTIKDLAEECGINPEYAFDNMYYSMWVLDPGMEMIVGCIVVALIVVFFAVMVIYNIFQVGLIQKIQEYGKIKALGATKKQMKQLIFREGMILSVLSIPIGWVLGFFMAKVSFGWLIEQGNMASIGIPNSQVPLFSATLMLVSILISLLTVILALRKPMKIVSKISPIEATRYLENSTKKNHGMRKGQKNISVFSLAMANVVGNKKRTIGTILTMGLSCV